MSEPAAKRLGSGRSCGNGVTASFCERCDRLLYVTDPDLLFCPVCSSLVSRIEPVSEPDRAQGTRAAD